MKSAKTELNLRNHMRAVLLAGLVLAGCRAARGSEEAAPGDSPTAWPTLVPVEVTGEGTGQIGRMTGPQLIDKFRVDLLEGTTALYPLEGHFDQPVRIEVIVLEGELDPVISVANAAGHSLAYANSGGTGAPEVIGQFQFPEDGFYELGVGAVEGGGQLGVSIYSLEQADVEGALFTSVDQELHGTLEQPASYHTFQLPVERGQRFDVSATALTEGLDLVFELYGPDGALLVARDDNIGKDPILWNFMPRQSGTYTIVLSNFDEHTGRYALKVSPSESGGEAAIGTRTELELVGAPRRSVWLTFSGRALDLLRLEARTLTTGVNISMSLYDPYGNNLVQANLTDADDSEEMRLVQLPFDGEYQVEFVTLGESGTIEYLIRPTSAPEEDLGGRVGLTVFPHEGVFEGPGGLITYTFDANAGDLVAVAARAARDTELDLVFDIYGPDGYLLASHDDDVGKDPIADRIELPQTGRYVIAVWNYNGTTGSFEIVIANPEAPIAAPDGR